MTVNKFEVTPNRKKCTIECKSSMKFDDDCQ